MDDLARGWAIMVAQMHGHRPGAVIAILISTMTPIVIAGWLSMAARRKRNAEDCDAGRLTPIKRTLIPGSEKDYRR